MTEYECVIKARQPAQAIMDDLVEAIFEAGFGDSTVSWSDTDFLLDITRSANDVPSLLSSVMMDWAKIGSPTILELHVNIAQQDEA